MILHIPAFWIGFLSFPGIALIALSFAGFSYRQSRAIRTWFIGLPIVQWPAMFLVVLGCKVLRSKKYCHYMQYDQRFWISPNTEGWSIPEEKI
jgi:uncharacterized membrane protein YoaT (DUF817 family)